MVPEEGGMLISSSKSRCRELFRLTESATTQITSQQLCLCFPSDTQFHLLCSGWFWNRPNHMENCEMRKEAEKQQLTLSASIGLSKSSFY